jgi:hypothetical protein
VIESEREREKVFGRERDEEKESDFLKEENLLLSHSY